MTALKTYRRKLDLSGHVDLSHGAGGRAMVQLISDVFHAALDNEWLRRGDDQSVFEPPKGRMAMATDAFVGSPLFFPGGDIGSLAVHGTVNDIAMSGATPLYLSASFIIEEGFPLVDLARIAESRARPRAPPASPSSPGTRRLWSGARPMASSSRRPVSALCRMGCRFRAIRRDRATS